MTHKPLHVHQNTPVSRRASTGIFGQPPKPQEGEETMEKKVKDDTQHWTIEQQTIEDLVSGLTFQFVRMPSGAMHLRLTGTSLEFGNRTLVFDEAGEWSGSGTDMTAMCTESPRQHTLKPQEGEL